MSQGVSHVSQGVSHVSQGVSHVSQGASHASHGFSLKKIYLKYAKQNNAVCKYIHDTRNTIKRRVAKIKVSISVLQIILKLE